MPLTNLRVLNLSRCEKLTDLGPLRALTNLRMLSIAGIDNIVDFAPLMEMKLSVILVEPKLLNLLPPELKLRAKVARRTGRSGISSIPVTEFQASRATRNGHDVP
jgi:hypothetical protein